MGEGLFSDCINKITIHLLWHFTMLNCSWILSILLIAVIEPKIGYPCI